MTNQTRANNEQIRYFVILAEPRATRVAVTSFLFIVYRYDNRYRVRPPPKHLLPLLSRSILNCLYARFDPNCHRYYWPATYRGRKTEKSRNCYRDALFDVEPRKSQAKTRKGKEKRNYRLLRSLRLLLLGHRYPWRNFISTPLSLPLSLLHTLYDPPRLSR